MKGAIRGHAWTIAAIGVLCLAALLRFETLGQRPLWFDESFVRDFVMSAEGPAEVWEGPARKRRANPPLHLLLAYWTLELGDSPAALRLPSALGGVAAVALVMWLGSILYGRRTGVTAGFLMAICTYQIDYSQEARAYALFLALTVGQYLSLFQYLERRKPALLIPLVLLGTGSLYAHNLAVLNQASIAMIGSVALGKGVLEAGRRWRPSRELMELWGALLAIGLLYLPGVEHVADYLGSRNLRSEHTLLLSPRVFHALFERWGAGPGPVAYLYDVSFLVGVVATVMARNVALGLLLWFASPFLVFGIVPFSKFFDIRFVMVAYPPFVILVARGVVSLAEAARGLSSLAVTSPRVGLAVRDATLTLILIAFGVASLQAYRVFRTTEVRCSEFFRNEAILHMDGGFCRNHFLLNTLIDEDRFILRRFRVDPGE